MNQTTDIYTLELKPASGLKFTFVFQLAFSLVALGLLAYLLIIKAPLYLKNNFLLILFPLAFIQIAFRFVETSKWIMWIFKGNETITLDKTTMTINKIIGQKETNEVYEINQLTDLYVEENSRAQSLLRSLRLTSNYYKNPIVLFYKYNGKRKRIGNYCAAFPADELRAEILKRGASK